MIARKPKGKYYTLSPNDSPILIISYESKMKPKWWVDLAVATLSRTNLSTQNMTRIYINVNRLVKKMAENLRWIFCQK